MLLHCCSWFDIFGMVYPKISLWISQSGLSRFGGGARVWYGDCRGCCVLQCIGSKRPSAIEQPWAWPAYQPSHVIGRQSPDWDEEKMENKTRNKSKLDPPSHCNPPILLGV